MRLRLPRELIRNLEATGDFKEAVEVSREEWVPYLEKTWGAEVKDCYRVGANLTLVLMQVWHFEGKYPGRIRDYGWSSWIDGAGRILLPYGRKSIYVAVNPQLPKTARLQIEAFE